MLTLNYQNWQNFACSVAKTCSPDEHNEAAIERLMEVIHPWVVDVKNVRPQFKTLNKILMIDFESPADREYYQKAFDRYMEDIAKIRASDMANSNFLELVAWLKFRQAAEFCRRRYLARQMYHAVQEGFAAGCACNFKATIAGVVLELHRVFKVSRDKISIVWGGDIMYSGSAKSAEVMTDAQIQATMMDLLAGKEVKMSVLTKIKKQLQAQNQGLGEIPSYLRLGPQNFKDRQEEIDRYQRGDALYSLFNFKSGGVGLSLHHSDSLTKQKCRKKANGYAVEEDIALIPTRPRRSFIAPTYSAIELVQGLGRYPRIASLSDTEQTLVFYKGTIEQQVAAVVSTKLRCLSKVVRQRESWEDVILKQRGEASRNIVPDEEKIDGGELFNIDIDDNEEEDDEKDN